MSLVGNQKTTRAINRRLVLNQLRNNGPMSRAAVAGVIQLSPAAVTLVTADLIQQGLVVETDTVRGSTGRRPIPLDINYDARLSIGLKVMVDRVEGAITNLATRVLAEVSEPLPDHQPASVVTAAAEVTRLLVEKAKISSDRLIGVGMALSGHLDPETGICRNVPRFGWQEVPIAEMLADEVSVPVWIDNDANAFTVSQQLFGHCRGMSNIVGVALGRGVGAGLIMDGKVHRGFGGAAGEFGHNFEERGRRCECGRDGCLETYCTDQGLLQSWQLLDPKRYVNDPENLNQAANEGDPIALGILKKSGTRLGRHVAAIVNVVDPEMIVFGGEGVRFGKHLFDPLCEVLAEVSHPGMPKVAYDTQDTGWPRGAAALAIQHFFNFEATGGHS